MQRFQGCHCWQNSVLCMTKNCHWPVKVELSSLQRNAGKGPDTEIASPHYAAAVEWPEKLFQWCEKPRGLSCWRRHQNR